MNSIKYLVFIFDSKMTFRDYINYVEENCTKLIFTLSKSAKITRALKQEALKTIYIYIYINRKNFTTVTIWNPSVKKCNEQVLLQSYTNKNTEINDNQNR